MIRRPPRSTLFPYTTPSDLGHPAPGPRLLLRRRGCGPPRPFHGGRPAAAEAGREAIRGGHDAHLVPPQAGRPGARRPLHRYGAAGELARLSASAGGGILDAPPPTPTPPAAPGLD